MTTKIKADLIFEYNLLPIYLDNDTQLNNILSEYNYSQLLDILNSKNNNEFTIKFISIDLILNRIAVFSELFYSQTQIIKTWEISDFTALEQVIINDFINSL